MDKRELRKFSLRSRENIIKTVKEKGLELGLGEATFKDHNTSISKEVKRRLKDKKYTEVYKEIIEEVSYNIFIRLVAIKFLEVNDYVADKILIEENFKDKLLEKSFNYRLNYLNKFLPDFFFKLDDYELGLLKFDYSNEGFLYKLIYEFNENYLKLTGGGKLENIGWLHQYFNIPLKEEIDGRVKDNYKVGHRDIIAKTQLFTPSWIIKYMVENSLFRKFLEGQKNQAKVLEDFQMKYYIKEEKQLSQVVDELGQSRKLKKPEEIESFRLIDPAMGTGHILLYSFDIFMEIYKYLGYGEREAGRKIIENNIFGLDIDKRSSSLSYFLIMMKYRQYTDTINFKDINHNLKYFISSERLSSEIEEIEDLLEIFKYANELGSIIRIGRDYDFKALKELTSEEEILSILNIGEILTNKYDLVITNPPYLSSSNMGERLLKYTRENYKDTWRDLFAVFMDVANNLLKEDGYYSMINQHSWMFLSSYWKFRKKLLKENNIVNLLHLGPKVFDMVEVGTLVQSVAFVMSKFKNEDYRSVYYRLLDGETSEEKRLHFLRGESKYVKAKREFTSMDKTPLAYWVSKNISQAFLEEKKIKDLYNVKQGMTTSNNKKFLRNWREVDYRKIAFNMRSLEEAKESKKKWFPYNKGGMVRKWYGNHNEIINYYNDGEEIKEYTAKLPQGTWVRIKSRDYYFREGISWTYITDLESFGARYIPDGFIFDVSGSSLFVEEEDRYYILGLLCSKVSIEFMKVLNPTMNFQVRDIKNIPVKQAGNKKDLINKLVKENIKISKIDWDLGEKSWDFRRPGILDKDIVSMDISIENRLNEYSNYINNNFKKLRENEERLNEIYIGLYGLEEEVDKEVLDRDISLTKIFKNRESVYDEIKGNPYIKTRKELVEDFLSYFIGCLFGRYSLDREGIVYGGGQFKLDKYTRFIPLKENLLDLDSDLLVNKLKEFLIIGFGEKGLTRNLDYIFRELGYKNHRDENIKDYFKLKFFKNHVRNYNKQPIYFKYKSGRENAFNGLFYLHRYKNSDLEALKELLSLKFQEYEIKYRRYPLDETRKKIEELAKYIKKLKEIKKINLDLDQGIVYNYRAFQNYGNKEINILEKI